MSASKILTCKYSQASATYKPENQDMFGFVRLKSHRSHWRAFVFVFFENLIVDENLAQFCGYIVLICAGACVADYRRPNDDGRNGHSRDE